MQEILNSLPEPMQLNETLFIIAGIFLVLLFLLNALVFKPLLAVMDERHRRIETGKEAQAKSMKAVEDGMAAYQSKVIEARRAAQQKRVKVLKESEMVREETLAAAREQSLAMVQAAVTEIDEQVKKAKDSLRHEAQEVAQRIVSSVLARAVH